MAGAADYSERPDLRAPRCELGGLRISDLCHAHGLAMPRGRETEERLPLLYRPRLQHLPGAPVFADGASDLSKLEQLAQAVLDARASYPEATLADLYDPDLMPGDLRKVHQALDRAVDRLYRRSGFQSECERIEHLFRLYEKTRVPLDATSCTRRKRRRIKVLAKQL